jgi:hypothetical protein
MGFADHYFSKQTGFSPYIDTPPAPELKFILVIPAYCEPGLTDTLESLWNCSRPEGAVEVILVINSAEDDNPSVIDANRTIASATGEWIAKHSEAGFRFFIISSLNMPARDAGVGLARKTGMDEALYRFSQVNNTNGFIISLDADSLCDKNYFTAIERAIASGKMINGFCIYFEHPLSGSEFPDHVYRAIAAYELHLRYNNLFLRNAGFPHAYHTIGSCFGVKAEIYARQGGMNKRKAGEDFYFLHKIISLGNFIEINSTRVLPSPRPSDRVPFGTGMAVDRFIASNEAEMLTYSPEIFLNLKLFIKEIQSLYKANPETITSCINRMPESLKKFLTECNAVQEITQINDNCRTFPAFFNRFFRWFDAFKIVKYLNYSSRDFHNKVPVNEAAREFLNTAGYECPPGANEPFELLRVFRNIEKSAQYLKS